MTKGSIACNYLSKYHGWSQIRFFAMDREENQPLSRVLFTVQNIQEERLNMEQNEMRIKRSESGKKAKSIFFDILSDRSNALVKTIQNQVSEITKESKDEPVIKSAEIITQESTSLLQMTEKLKNASELYAGTMKLDPSEYSFGDMMKDVYQQAEQAIGEKEITIQTNISPLLPSKLYGDQEHIKKILNYLMINSIEHGKILEIDYMKNIDAIEE